MTLVGRSLGTRVLYCIQRLIVARWWSKDGLTFLALKECTLHYNTMQGDSCASTEVETSRAWGSHLIFLGHHTQRKYRVFN